MTTPIRPDQLSNPALPDKVIEVFNALIVDNDRDGMSSFKADLAVKAIAKALGTTTSEVYRMRYLDVESVYQEAGWKVKYDQPMQSEPDFDAYFEFRYKPHS